MSHDIGVILNLQSFVTFFLIPIFFNTYCFVLTVQRYDCLRTHANKLTTKCGFTPFCWCRSNIYWRLSFHIHSSLKKGKMVIFANQEHVDRKNIIFHLIIYGSSGIPSNGIWGVWDFMWWSLYNKKYLDLAVKIKILVEQGVKVKITVTAADLKMFDERIAERKKQKGIRHYGSTFQSPIVRRSGSKLMPTFTTGRPVRANLEE